MTSTNRTRGSLVTPTSESNQNYTTKSYNYDWSPYAEQSGNVSTKTKYSQISDVYEPYGIGVWHYKPCIHINMANNEFVPPTNGDRKCVHRFYTGSYPRGTMDSNALSIGNPSGDPWEYASGLVDTDMANQLQNKLNSKLPSLKDRMPDMLVFLLELKDIKNTFRFLKEKAISKKIAGAHLSYSFGVAPFVRDVQRFCRRVADFRNRISRVIEGAGKVHDLSTSVFWDLHENEDGYTDKTDCPYKGAYYAECVASLATKYTRHTKARLGVTVKYRYGLPPAINNLFGGLGNMLVSMGINPSLDSAWELVPFSFVVDWVFNTDKLFRKLGVDQLGFDAQVEILDMCVVLEHMYTRSFGLQMSCFGISQVVKRDRINTFARWVGPDALESFLPWLQLPSFMQLLLGASLTRVRT